MPVSAEQLMRSRYSAYALGEYQYLIDTHYPETRGSLSVAELKKTNQGTRWLGLEVLAAEETQVSFRAYFLEPSGASEERLHCLHESSRFLKDGDQWLYVDGQHDPKNAVLPRRKDPCFCGSGKKLKNCHGDLIPRE